MLRGLGRVIISQIKELYFWGWEEAPREKAEGPEWRVLREQREIGSRKLQPKTDVWENGITKGYIKEGNAGIWKVLDWHIN